MADSHNARLMQTLPIRLEEVERLEYREGQSDDCVIFHMKDGRLFRFMESTAPQIFALYRQAWLRNRNR